MQDDRKLDKVVICCLSKDRLAIEYTQKAVDYLTGRYKLPHMIPDAEESFSSGSFSGDEYDPHFRTDVTGKNVYSFGIPNIPSIAMHYVSPGELITRMILTAQAAYDNGAAKVRAVFTDLPFSRADKTANDFGPETAAYTKNLGRGKSALSIAKMMHAAGIDELITLDLHSDRVREFYRQVYGTDVVHVVDPNPLTAHYVVNESSIKINNHGENLVIVSVDAGSEPKVDSFGNMLTDVYGLENVSILYLNKVRTQPNNPDELIITVRGTSENFTTLSGKYILIPDDIVDTAGTFSGACRQITRKGLECNGNGKEIPKGIIGVLTHPVLAGMAYEAPMKKLASAGIEELVMFNSHPFVEDNLIYPLKKNTSIIRTAWVMAEAIHHREHGRDVNDIFRDAGDIDPRKVKELFNLKRSSSYRR